MASLSKVTVVRAALVADVTGAWSPVKICTSAPELEWATQNHAEGEPALPLAAILLPSVPFDARFNGAPDVGPRMRWTILGRWEKPQGIDSAELAALKDARLNELIALLSQTPPRYPQDGVTDEANQARWIGNDLVAIYNPDETDAGRGYYQVAVQFTLHG